MPPPISTRFDWVSNLSLSFSLSLVKDLKGEGFQALPQISHRRHLQLLMFVCDWRWQAQWHFVWHGLRLLWDPMGLWVEVDRYRIDRFVDGSGLKCANNSLLWVDLISIPLIWWVMHGVGLGCEIRKRFHFTLTLENFFFKAFWRIRWVVDTTSFLQHISLSPRKKGKSIAKFKLILSNYLLLFLF